MDKAENCNSCGKRLVGSGITSFPCPACGNSVIGRCAQCRDQSVEYYCKGCNFQGP